MTRGRFLAVRFAAAVLAGIALLFRPASPAAAQEDGPIAITVPGQQGDYRSPQDELEPTASPLAEAFTETLARTLRLASSREVVRLDFLLPEVDLEPSVEYYRDEGIETAVFGRITTTEGASELVLVIWRAEEMQQHTWELREENVSDVAAQVASLVLQSPVSLGNLIVAGVAEMERYAVFADGVLLGRDRADYRVVAGAYQIVVAVPTVLGDQPVLSERVRIEPEETSTVSVSEAVRETGEDPDVADNQTGRPRETGSLRVDAGVPDAEVSLDGTVLGTVPFERVGIPVGRYELAVSAPGFRTVTELAEVMPGRAEEIDLNLEIDPTAPEVARLLQKPSHAAYKSIAALGIKTTFFLFGIDAMGELSPTYYSPVYAATWIAVGLPAVGAAGTGRTGLSLILNGANALVGGTFVALAAVNEARENREVPSGQVYVNTNFFNNLVFTVLGVAGSAVALAELALSPLGAERANDAVAQEIERTGEVPEPHELRRRYLSFESGGGSLARINYHQPVFGEWLAAELGVGAHLSSIEPFRVGPNAAARLIVRPFPVPPGAFTMEVVGEAIAEVDWPRVGFSLGAGTNTVLRLNRLDLFWRATLRYGMRTGNRGLFVAAGVRL